MKVHKLSWNFDVEVSRCWTPYFKFDITPSCVRDTFIAAGFQDAKISTHDRDSGCPNACVFDLEKTVSSPFRLHCRIYANSTARVHLETDLMAISHGIAEDVVRAFYKKRGNLVVRLVRGVWAGVKYFQKFKVAFAMHDEESLKTGIDTGDYVMGAMLTKEFLDGFSVEYDVDYELREQITYEESANLRRRLGKLCTKN